MATTKRKIRTKARKAEPQPEICQFQAQHGDYRPCTVVDLTGELGGRRQSMIKVLRNHASTTIDRWLKDGGPGFEAPQKQAIEHMRGLWAIVGHGPALVANYVGVGGGRGDREGYMSALHSLSAYEREFPPYVWSAFEAVVRWDEPAGVAGSRLAHNSAQQQAHAKACVGFVASKIAEWRGY